MVKYAINVLFDRLLWMIRSIKLGDAEVAPIQEHVEECILARDLITTKLASLAIGEQSDSSEEVRRTVSFYVFL